MIGNIARTLVAFSMGWGVCDIVVKVAGDNPGAYILALGFAVGIFWVAVNE